MEPISAFIAAVSSLALTAGLLVGFANPAAAAIDWMQVTAQNNETQVSLPGPAPDGTSVTFVPNSHGDQAHATFSQILCETQPSCYETSVGSASPSDYVAELVFTFDQWISDVRWNFQGIGKAPGQLVDSARVFVTTDGGATWEPLNFNGTGSGGVDGLITRTSYLVSSGPPAWNVGNDNSPQTGGVSCLWTELDEGCLANVQADIKFPVAINGIKVSATGVPGNGAGSNLFNPFIGYDPDNPPVPPTSPTPPASPTSPTPGGMAKPLKPRSLKVKGGPRSKKRVVSWSTPSNPRGTRPTQWYRLKLNLRGCRTIIINKKLSKSKRSYSFSRNFLLRHSSCKRARGEVRAATLKYRVRVEAFNSRGGGPIATRHFTIRR